MGITSSSFQAPFRTWTVLLVLAGLSFAALPSSAAIIVSVESVVAQSGSTGNALDVEITNSGPLAVTISGFNFDLGVASSLITFTGATTATAEPYIFGSNSLFGPDLAGPGSEQSLAVADIFAIPGAGTTLDAGATLGLARILFNVSAGAPNGSVLVSLAPFPATALSGPDASHITIDTLSTGEIMISGTAVPEPSSMFLIGGGFVAGLLLRRQRHRI